MSNFKWLFRTGECLTIAMGLAVVLAACGGGGGGNTSTPADVMYFAGQSDAATSYQLWKTDGTASGTVAVKTLNLAGGSYPMQFAALNGVTYFTAFENNTSTPQLWRTDGTADGTIALTAGSGVNLPV
jgi:ELWxxDGT repeat protein